MRASSVVIEGRVVAIKPSPDADLVVGRLEPAALFKGRRPAGTVSIVEEREVKARPAILDEGARGIAFLRRAQSNSRLRSLVGREAAFTFTEERWGWIPIPGDADREAIVAVLERHVALGRGLPEDPEARAGERRALLFLELVSPSPRLAEDGVAGLASLPDLGSSLTATERKTVGAALRRSDLPLRAREQLIQQVGIAGLREFAPLLRTIGQETPLLLESTLAARRRLGDAADREEITQLLHRPEAEARAAAARSIADGDAQGALPVLRKLALSDSDADVRVSAVEGLGRIASPEAIEVLGQAFIDQDGLVRQAAIQALYSIGGEAGADVLAEIAFEGPPGSQAHAVVVLMALGLERDDPHLVRIREEHPDKTVRDLVTHGVEIHGH